MLLFCYPFLQNISRLCVITILLEYISHKQINLITTIIIVLSSFFSSTPTKNRWWRMCTLIQKNINCKKIISRSFLPLSKNVACDKSNEFYFDRQATTRMGVCGGLLYVMHRRRHPDGEARSGGRVVTTCCPRWRSNSRFCFWCSSLGCWHLGSGWPTRYWQSNLTLMDVLFTPRADMRDLYIPNCVTKPNANDICQIYLSNKNLCNKLYKYKLWLPSTLRVSWMEYILFTIGYLTGTENVSLEQTKNSV